MELVPRKPLEKSLEFVMPAGRGFSVNLYSPVFCVLCFE